MSIPFTGNSLQEKIKKMKEASLVFIPSPAAGHLGSAVEMAKLLVNHDHRISVTILIFKYLDDPKLTQFIHSLSASTSSNNKIQFIHLPTTQVEDKNPRSFLLALVESQKPNVKEAVTKLINSPHSSPPLVGFVLDMFCATMMDVADEFSVPSYLFFPSSAIFLGFSMHIETLHYEMNVVDFAQFKDSDKVLDIPTLKNPLPGKFLPSIVLTNQGFSLVLDIQKRWKQTKGIIVNSFLELETYALNSINHTAIAELPPVYPIGPILNLKGDGDDPESDEFKDTMKWLDDQPSLSVIFLCFGSMGSFREEQVKEMASAIENTGYRFLWSLRKPPPKGQIRTTSDYVNPKEVLPEGFLERTAVIGKIIGWAPQAAILGHPAIAGFVSHCGWNSILESIWFGVPIAAWPMYAEQQINAFEMVVELGLAVEVKMDYKKQFGDEPQIIISAGEIERGIRSLMEMDGEKRNNVKKMSEISRNALLENGSSYTWLSELCADIIENV